MMTRRCEKCAGQPFCTCPKKRPKKSEKRLPTVHRWSHWARAKRDGPDGHGVPTDLLVRICSRCGQARTRKA